MKMKAITAVGIARQDDVILESPVTLKLPTFFLRSSPPFVEKGCKVMDVDPFRAFL